MPAYMVEEKEPNLRKLRGLFIDYGEKEEFSHIVIGANQFSKALSDRRIPHTLEVYGRGDHGSRIRERMRAACSSFSQRGWFFRSRTLALAQAKLNIIAKSQRPTCLVGQDSTAF